MEWCLVEEIGYTELQDLTELLDFSLKSFDWTLVSKQLVVAGQNNLTDSADLLLPILDYYQCLVEGDRPLGLLDLTDLYKLIWVCKERVASACTDDIFIEKHLEVQLLLTLYLEILQTDNPQMMSKRHPLATPNSIQDLIDECAMNSALAGFVSPWFIPAVNRLHRHHNTNTKQASAAILRSFGYDQEDELRLSQASDAATIIHTPPIKKFSIPETSSVKSSMLRTPEKEPSSASRRLSSNQRRGSSPRVVLEVSRRLAVDGGTRTIKSNTTTSAAAHTKHQASSGKEPLAKLIVPESPVKPCKRSRPADWDSSDDDDAGRHKEGTSELVVLGTPPRKRLFVQ